MWFGPEVDKAIEANVLEKKTIGKSGISLLQNLLPNSGVPKNRNEKFNIVKKWRMEDAFLWLQNYNDF